MTFECGQSVEVKDPYGARSLRFIAQCHGQWLVVNHVFGGLPPNGYLVPDWRSVLRELVAKTVPAKMANERGLVAESQAVGLYHCLPLTWPLSAAGLAGLLGEDEQAVRAQLGDLAVQYE